MIFKECLTVAFDRRLHVIAGQLVGDGSRPDAYPLLKIRASIAESKVSLGEATTTRAGEFRLEVGISLPASVRLELVDRDGAVVGESALELREPMHRTAMTVSAERLAASKPVRVEGPAPALLNRASVEALRTHVRALIENGALDADAIEELDRGIQPLAWADGLMTDARGVLAGNSDSADRLRAALLSLGAPSATPLLDETQVAPPADDVETERDESERIVDRTGLAQLAAAVVWAVDDRAEVQAMVNGLAAVLWSSPWLELLLRAGTTGAAPAMKPLMSGPGAGWGLPPGMTGIPLPSPGLPPVPGGLPPGWGKVPRPKGRVPGKLADLVPDLKIPINQMPSEEEKCLAGAMATVAIRKRALPQYEIRGIEDAQACPGTVIVLTGVNFGTGGSVVFPGKGAGVVATDVPLWSDTAIRVRVPQGASPGVIRLSIYEGSLCLCGRLWTLYRLGRTLPTFEGGVPVVLNFNVNGAVSAITAEPGESVTVTLTTTTGSDVTVQLLVRNGGTTVFDSGSLPGGFHALTFSTPAVKASTTLNIEIRATNHCGTSVEAFTILVVKQPRLRILQAEVTQAIQRLDNSVRLGANRRTMVRVYIDSGLGLFSFGANASNLPGVTGRIRISRASQQLADVAPLNAPFTTIATFFPNARYGFGGSLNFMLPPEHLSGDITLDISVQLATFPAGVVAGPTTTTSRTVQLKFEPLRKMSLVRIMLADAWRGLAAPTVAEWQTALQGAMTRFPTADNAWEVRIHPSHTVVTVDCDLSDDDGWDDVLEELDDVAGDADDSWEHCWVGLLPAFRSGIDSFTTRGMARTETTDRPWPLSNDYLVMACLAGSPDIFAHEMGHIAGIDHANCPAGVPDDVDPSLPAFIEETGVDLYAMTVVLEFTTGDLMGYCTSNGLWPSTVTWQRLIERLD